MAEVILDVSAAALEAFASSPTGPVVLLMAEKGALVEELARKNAPKGATGTLEDSIHALPPIVTGSRIEVEVVADAPYALAVHNGSRAHTIVPRGARVLAWEGPQGPVFAMRANIPERAGNPFLRTALEEGIA